MVPTRLPITLITGFLGSGKTTLLRRIADAHAGSKLVFLVNEFNPRDVDGALLSNVPARVISLPGGSIFCRCLVSEFMKRLQAIRNEHPDAVAVVIEASGIADPRAMARMLAETRLEEFLELSRIVCVVDPRTLRKLRHTLPNIVSQVAAADLIIVNKVDRASAEEVSETLALVRELNPTADVRQTRHCATDLPLTTRGVHDHPDGEYAPCRDPNFATFTTRAGVAHLELVRRVIEKHAAVVYRVKGFVEADAGGTLYVDFSGGEFATEPRPNSPGEAGELVWIVRGDASDRIRAALEMPAPEARCPILPIPLAPDPPL
jgi:G3E family GTPase